MPLACNLRHRSTVSGWEGNSVSIIWSGSVSDLSYLPFANKEEFIFKPIKKHVNDVDCKLLLIESTVMIPTLDAVPSLHHSFG